MKFNFSGRKTPRSVTEITSSFTDIVNELSERIDHDDAQIKADTASIQSLQENIAKTANSKHMAISIRSRINALIGN